MTCTSECTGTCRNCAPPGYYRAETQKTINEWQEQTFGKTEAWAAFERMQKEYWELRDAIHLLKTDATLSTLNKAREEVADVYITLCRVAYCLGADIQSIVDHKMAINRARKWVVDASGNGQHEP